MALAPSKKKKIIRIIIIIASRVADFLDVPNETSASEEFLDCVIEAKAGLYDLPEDPTTGTKTEQDMWAEVENAANALESGNPTEAEIEAMKDSFWTAYGNL